VSTLVATVLESVFLGRERGGGESGPRRLKNIN
jgi:hypothetical protein